MWRLLFLVFCFLPNFSNSQLIFGGNFEDPQEIVPKNDTLEDDTNVEENFEEDFSMDYEQEDMEESFIVEDPETDSLQGKFLTASRCSLAVLELAKFSSL